MNLEYRGIPLLYSREDVCTGFIKAVNGVRVLQVQKSTGATSVLGCHPDKVEYPFTLYEKTEGP